MSAPSIKQILAQMDQLGASIDEVTGDHDRLRVALQGLVEIIEKAGLQQLANGVELGAMSWYVKATDRLDFAKKILGETKERT